MIGGGVFNLPSDMSEAAAPGAIVIGRLITGTGMLMLAFVYRSRATRKPDLNAGPYAYKGVGEVSLSNRDRNFERARHR